MVVLSTLIRFFVARTAPAPFIFQDELLYADLARSLGTLGHFAVRGVPGIPPVGPVYPALISPAYALFDSVPQAYTAVKAINSLLMSLGAIPVYLIARRLLAPFPSLVAAAFALAIPWLAFTSRTMTENAFYPIFLFWFLALLLTLERPTLFRQAAMLVLLGLGYETRPQALVLAPALVGAIALVVVGEAWLGASRPRWRQALRHAASFWVTWAALALAALFFLVVEVGIRGQTLSQSLLRAYSPLTNSQYGVGEVLRWTVWEIAELDVVIGVLPFAAFLAVILTAYGRERTSPALRAFAVAGFTTSLCMFVAVGVFASSPYGNRIQDRPLFYIVPLFLIALVLWAWRGVGRVWPLAAVAALVAAALPGIAPFPSFLNQNTVNDSFGLLNILVLRDKVGAAPYELMVPITLAAIGAGLLFLVAPGRWAIVPVALVFAFLAYGNRSVQYFLDQAGRDALTASIQNRRDWVDHAVGGNADVTFVYTSNRFPVALWENEFFNRSVNTVYTDSGHLDGLPQQGFAIDPRTGALNDPAGTQIHARYVLTDSSHLIAGRLVAEDTGARMSLYRVDGPLRLSGAFAGIYSDEWSDASPSFTAWRCHGGTLTLRLTGDPNLMKRPQTIVARDGKRVIAKTLVPPRVSRVPMTVPVTGSNGRCNVDFTITPSVVPAEVFGGGDTRRLGLRFEEVRYRPAR
jgi:hypothetical protein